jgi:hypothetical protein
MFFGFEPTIFHGISGVPWVKLKARNYAVLISAFHGAFVTKTSTNEAEASIVFLVKK